MANPAGEIGRLREEELPVVRVIVPPDPGGRVFEDDLDPDDLVFDSKLTPMLIWHGHYPVGRGWRSGWVLSYDTDGNGNPDDYRRPGPARCRCRRGTGSRVLAFGRLPRRRLAVVMTTAARNLSMLRCLSRGLLFGER